MVADLKECIFWFFQYRVKSFLIQNAKRTQMRDHKLDRGSGKKFLGR